jgi:hypothetical protein
MHIEARGHIMAHHLLTQTPMTVSLMDTTEFRNQVLTLIPPEPALLN